MEKLSKEELIKQILQNREEVYAAACVMTHCSYCGHCVASR